MFFFADLTNWLGKVLNSGHHADAVLHCAMYSLASPSLKVLVWLECAWPLTFLNISTWEPSQFDIAYRAEAVLLRSFLGVSGRIELQLTRSSL